MLATMMLPGQVTVIPVFILFKNLGWIDSFAALTVPAFFGTPFYIFLLRQFFMTVPRELEDAARIDGCGTWGVFWHVILPMAKPALAAVAVFSFMASWNDSTARSSSFHRRTSAPPRSRLPCSTRRQVRAQASECTTRWLPPPS